MSDDSDEHIESARARLVHLAGLAAKTEATEHRILDAGEEMLARTKQDLRRLRPRVHTDPAAAARYEALTLERGRLELVVAQARQHLGQ